MKSIIISIQQQTNLTEQEAWWMLEHITQKTKAVLLHSPNESLSAQQLCTMADWIQKLSKESIPLAYLLKTVPFLDLTIKVKPPILIPRQETEEWTAQLIQELQPYSSSITSILEIGTGSGCIALALASTFTDAHITATDINPDALKLAHENATLNHINNVSFLQSDVFDHVLPTQTFDLIVSNPPYIDPIHKDTMIPQVIKWEDPKALFAQEQGLLIIKNIFKQAQNYIHHRPEFPYQLVIEHDNGQQEKIKDFAKHNGFDCSAKKDLFGNVRTSWCKIIN